MECPTLNAQMIHLQSIPFLRLKEDHGNVWPGCRSQRTWAAAVIDRETALGLPQHYPCGSHFENIFLNMFIKTYFVYLSDSARPSLSSLFFSKRTQADITLASSCLSLHTVEITYVSHQDWHQLFSLIKW